MRWISLLIIGYVLNVCQVKAQTQSITVDAQFSNVNIGNDFVGVVEDKTKSISFEQAKELSYTTSEQNVPNFGFNNSSFWFRFEVKNVSNKDLNVYLSVKNPNLDIARLFYYDTTGRLVQQAGGDYFPFHTRVIKDKYVRFPVLLPAGKSVWFYLNAQNSGEQFSVPISIGNETYFSNEVTKEQTIFGIYFGIILLSLLLNIFFYFILKDKTSIYYVAYLTGLLFLQLSLTGVGFQYIWPESIFLANHANPIFANLSILFLILFTLSFLTIGNHLPRLSRFYKFIGAVVVVSSTLAWIAHPTAYIVSVLTINLVALVLNVMIIPTAWYILRRGYKPARFFITAFVVLIISVFVFVMKNFGIAPSNFFTEYGIQIGSAIEVSLLSLAVIDRFKQFRDQALSRLEEVNKLKTEANIVLERKVDERTAEIQQQKIEIERKNEEILSSIRYAGRIQDALLQGEGQLAQMFRRHFILFKPKDIVSGDFYWTGKKQDWLYTAVADCTGHGVPGAFLTMLGTSFLNDIIGNADQHIPPHLILDELRTRFILALGQQGRDNFTRDGMDIALVAINRKTKHLQYAGANNPLWLVGKIDNAFLQQPFAGSGKVTIHRYENHQVVLMEVKADKQPIGIHEVMKPFQLREFYWHDDMSVYLFSDGYADQFGGPLGKKFRIARMRELIASLNLQDLAVQKIALEDYLQKWRAFGEGHEQVDDICIVGIQL